MLGVLLAGLLAGIVSGMGIGGGAILIPVILWVTDVTQQQAQGKSKYNQSSFHFPFLLLVWVCWIRRSVFTATAVPMD